MPDIDRIDRLCDLENIRDLCHRYVEQADVIDGRKGDPAAFAGLFSRDGTLDLGGGLLTGRKEIEGMLRANTMPWHYCMHYMLNHLITLDGGRATGRISILGALAMDKIQTPIWVSGLYHDEYVRTPEGWRINSRRFQMILADPAFMGGNRK